MTETEVADAILEVIGFDTTEPRFVEVEAGNAMNEIIVEVEGGQRFAVAVSEIPA